MLKAIELSGFKSFADKTRFEFPAGITVIVGPNGSGKSNIVDAVKWVLGEQSAKSLRGKEMADVIFKGSSGANARKPANAATVSLVLENAEQRLLNGPHEIHVTRRVYRSGESEYLINNEPCRLKDIRNLFRGTGLATDAYSLIEQGKVDRLLQANPKDRRAIFEEAAGISRFKVKKLEAERRLERVDANLVRLADIVEEVGSRYRSVKNQASKAARFKELSDRLNQLRTHVGCYDYRQLGLRMLELQEQEPRLADLQNQLERSLSQIQEAIRTQQQSCDRCSDTLRAAHEEHSQIRAELAQQQSQHQLHSQRLIDLQTRAKQLSEQRERVEQRVVELDQQMQAAGAERQRLSSEQDAAAATLAAQTARQTDLQSAAAASKAVEERLRAELASATALLKQIRDRLAEFRSQSSLHNHTQKRLEAQIAELIAKQTTDRMSIDELNQQAQQLHREAESNDGALQSTQQAVESLQRELEQLRGRIVASNNELTGVKQRAEVIEELERRWEGINAGAKDILLKSQQATSGPLRNVVGLVADVIRVHVQHAPLVDAALGNVAQFLITKTAEFLDAMQRGDVTVTGRVGVLSLDRPTSLGADWQQELADHPDLVGPLDNLVQCDPAYQEFVRRLLHGTWIVKSLSAARHMQQTVNARVRYVTLDGEVLEVDGTVLAGPKAAAIGLVSRRSELRALQRQSEQLSGQIEEWTQSETALVRELAKGQAHARQLLEKDQNLTAELARLEAQCQAAQQRAAMWDEQIATNTGELRETIDKLNACEAALLEDQQADNVSAASISNNEARLAEALSSQQQATRELAELDVEMATVRLRLSHLDDQISATERRCQELESQRTESRKLQENLEQQWRDDELASEQAQLARADAEAKTAALEQRRDALAQDIERWQNEYAAAERERRSLAEQQESKRDELQRTQNERRENQLRVESWQSEHRQLRQRLIDEYGIDVHEVEIEVDSRVAESRAQVDQEINELRQKVQSLGSINMEALVELETLESRYLALDQQYQDLVLAKDSLVRIIQRINGDSRRLFSETLEAIRGNFQRLFRLTFGGGHADIVLEEDVDVLEAGVEIVATPPGKPKFNNSLLSGGEKALTAVSLLMAIFQYRPSPFCVLDEVDAPFDEANIGRFIDVLKSFLGWTKFVIVTHSKKTMTAATTLYGVTMQESGVSKRVSVRFEDVSDDGHISQDAIDRDRQDPSDSNGRREATDRDSGTTHPAVA